MRMRRPAESLAIVVLAAAAGWACSPAAPAPSPPPPAGTTITGPTTFPLTPPPPSQPPPTGEVATIDRAVDGDTVDLMPGRGVAYVRIVAIDAPENGRSGAECWGPESEAFAQGELAGRVVTLVPDPEVGNRDRYGRLLRYVILPDGRNFSVMAAEVGAAEFYYDEPDVVHADEVRAAARRAQDAGLGMWGVCR